MSKINWLYKKKKIALRSRMAMKLLPKKCLRGFGKKISKACVSK